MITNLRMDLRFKLYPPPAAGRAIYVFAGECLRVLRRFQSGRGFWRLPPVTARWSKEREGKRVEGKICNDKGMRQCLFPWNFNQFFSLVLFTSIYLQLQWINLTWNLLSCTVKSCPESLLCPPHGYIIGNQPPRV